MVTLKLLRIEEYCLYVFENINTKELFPITLEFHKMKNPSTFFVLQIDEKLLDPTYEEYSHFYAFEPTTEKDYSAILITKEKHIYLRRLYG